MSIDVNSIHNIATAIADREREEHNKGKGSRSRDYETKEQARKKAAQLTIAIIVYAVILKFLWKGLCAIGRLNRKIFGERIGKIVNIISLCLILFIPCCVICSDVDHVVDHHQNSVNNAVLITKKRVMWQSLGYGGVASERRSRPLTAESKCIMGYLI